MWQVPLHPLQLGVLDTEHVWRCVIGMDSVYEHPTRRQPYDDELAISERFALRTDTW